MELTPGLHRIGNRIVAVHLVVTDDGITVIDAGFAGHYTELRSELKAAGRSLDDIRGIVLTHGDDDHIGFAARLHEERGVPIFVHPADAERTMGRERTNPPWGSMRLGATVGFLAYGISEGALRIRHPQEVSTFADGDTLDLPGSPQIIALPGHSPGSVAIHVPAVGALFVGDALTTRHVLTGRTGPQPAPFTDDPAAAAHSLARLEGLDAPWVLPGHGDPWKGGVPDLLTRYRAVAG